MLGNIEKVYKKIDYENLLNKSQLEAINSLYGPVLCIAGAGTGKTRTLVFRLAKMLESNISAENILLLTFTRKAAANMIRKASELMGNEALNVSGGTYHAFASCMLKKYGQYCGIPNTFSILDEADAENVIGLLKNEKQFSCIDRKFPDKRVLSKIFSKSRNFSLPIDVTLETSFKRYYEFSEEIQKLFKIYTEYKYKNSMLDYDDLLTFLYRLLNECDIARDSICGRFKYIMADEYQDTNELQAKITISLAGNEKNIMVVGDDAQSIYSFRGACIDNILNFPKHFDSCKIIKLEQNYRSSPQILSAANKLISYASRGFNKKIYTNEKDNVLPVLVRCADENQQALFVISRIAELYQKGIPLHEMAVLFRSASVSSELEIMLKQKGIPFVKWGGSSFLETIHIRDFLAHLRILCNPADKTAWLRVLNLVDGIGNVTATKIFEIVNHRENPFLLTSLGIKKKLEENLQKLSNTLIKASDFYKRPPTRCLEIISDYYAEILQKKYDDYKKRLKDLDKFSIIAERHSSLNDFLAEIELDVTTEPEANLSDKNRPLVLSTIHSAKGMEWNSVFILSALHGIFPSFASMKDNESYEEERRLMYVAMTRAKENLTISYPACIYDKSNNNLIQRPSDFLDSIKDTLDIWQIEG